MESNVNYTGLEIAIIGLSCRVPGASNWREFWENLVNEVESIRFLSDEELFNSGVSQSTINDKNYVKVGSSLNEKDVFDSDFFKYQPDEAKFMHPATKIFHECVWEALEDAGYVPDKTKASIGLYAGAGDDLSWRLYTMLKNLRNDVENFSLQQINNKDSLSTLISYKLNLNGPSVVVDTACSTSLVAVHLACRSLLLGESKMAVAGGINIHTEKQLGYFFQEGMVSSHDGRCRTFDKDSTGTILNEGAGVVVLKKLKDAINDNDHIYAVIKGSAINNDGAQKVGFTSPSVDGQTACVEAALKFSRVSPETINYIEAHGTGTKIGDPMEVKALNVAYSHCPPNSCAIGSVKTNIGHLDSAAGIIGLIKTSLSLYHKKIPSTLNFQEPNPLIPFHEGPFFVNTTLRNWEASSLAPRRAGVSSFGIGGTNAHIILEEAPKNDHQKENEVESGKCHLLTLSAETPTSLTRYFKSLDNYLENNTEVDLTQLCYTLNKGRKEFNYRYSVTFDSVDELRNSLKRQDNHNSIRKAAHKNSPVVFLFPGAGSQYKLMGKGLYEEISLFKELMNVGFHLLKSITNVDFKELLYGDSDENNIHNMLYAQPLQFLIEYCLANVLIKLGIKPDYVVGHSLGEYVAACISGILSFDDALKILVKRGELIAESEKGSMVSAVLSLESAKKYSNNLVSIAAVNGPFQVVFAGSIDAIRNLVDELEKDDVSYTQLFSSHAGHSYMMDSVLDKYRDVLLGLEAKKTTIPILSNLTGDFFSSEEPVQPEYWIRQMRNTVRFSDCIKQLITRDNPMLFIEVGPGHSLISFVKQHVDSNSSVQTFNLIRHPKEEKHDFAFFLNTIGSLWSSGVNINWNLFYEEKKIQKLPLPTYSFEKRTFLAEVDLMQEISAMSGFLPDRNGNELKMSIYFPGWKTSVLLPKTVIKDDKAILFFYTENDVIQNIFSELHQSGKRVIKVLIGTKHEKKEDNIYIINPTSEDDFQRLFAQLKHDEIEVSQIVYTWCINIDSQELTLNEDNHAVHLSFLSFSRIVKEAAKHQRHCLGKIAVITNSMHQILNDDVCFVEQSLIVGLINTTRQEYGLECYNIDINLNEIAIANEIVREIHFNDFKNARIVGYRNGERWVKDYTRNESHLVIEKSVLKANGTYLITGGLGNIGYTIAMSLIKEYDAKIILTGKTVIDQSNNVKGVSKSNDRLYELREQSDNVYYYSFDISDYNSFQNAVLEIEKKIGSIDGVIHTAGVLSIDDFELIDEITSKRSFEIFSPKVIGIKNIYKLFHNRSLDFMWATSSLASIISGLSFSAYSSANFYMEQFALSVGKNLPNWKCVALGELSLSFGSEQQNSASDFGLTSDDLYELFKWSLSLKNNTILVHTPYDLFDRINKNYFETKTSYIESEYDEAIILTSQKPDIKTAFEPASNELEEKLKLLFEQFFGFHEIGVNDNFFELGGDSLKGMNLIKRIKKETGMTISIGDFFESQTIRKISLCLLQKGIEENFPKLQTGSKPKGKRLIQLSQAINPAAKNIYFIPPVLGNSIIYKSLAIKLGEEFNCYGLQYSGLEEGEKFYSSIDEVVDDFINLIETNNDQEMIFVGFSMGATIAFECVKKLETKIKSSDLILIDRSIKTNRSGYFAKNRINKELNEIMSTYRLLIDDPIEDTLLESFVKNNIRILANYKQTGFVTSDLYVFESKDEPFKTNMIDWNEYTQGDFEFNYIEGTHWEALSETNQLYLVSQIQQLSKIENLL